MRDLAARRSGPIHVCFCVDEVMALPLGTAMASILLSRAPATGIEFHIVGVGLSARSKRAIEATVAGAAGLHWHDLGGEVHRILDRVALSSDRPYPPSAYARILAGRILPATLDRVIYLDADVIAVTDLRPLWEMDLGGAAMAAVPDVLPNDRRADRIRSTLTPEDCARFGFDGRQPYFSSGVLLIDLAQLRGAAEQELIALLQRYPTLTFPDQDALNIVLGPRTRRADLRWNQTGAAYWPEAAEWSGLDAAGLEELRQRPWIVHFAGKPKPWEPGCTHPFLPQWEEAYQRTPWAGQGEAGSSWRRLLQKGLRAHRVLRKKALRLLPQSR